MPLNFSMVDTNPNDSTGGGGSLAGPMQDSDAHGPYFVWPNQEFDNGASPFAVVAASEVDAMSRALAEWRAAYPDKREALAGGEVARVTRVPDQRTGAGDGPENPVYELADHQSTLDYMAEFSRDR